jgi:hypothetical protein
VKRIIEEEGLNFNTSNEMEFLKILRFLRARKFNVTQSMEMIRNDVKWREEANINELYSVTANDVLQCDLSLVYKYFPTWVQGFDKQNRPIAWRGFGRFEIWNVLKLTTMEKLLHFHAWETEQMLRIMDEKTKETGHNVETFTVVVDAAGWGVRLATSDAFAFIKGMAATDSDHYPERLGMVIVINAPSMLSWAWRIIQAFLDDVTKAKVRIMGCDPAEWQPVLFSLIDREQIPQQYGGDAEDIAPEDALSSLNPPADAKGPPKARQESANPANKNKGEKKKETKKKNNGAEDDESVFSKASKASKASRGSTARKKAAAPSKAANPKTTTNEKKKPKPGSAKTDATGQETDTSDKQKPTRQSAQAQQQKKSLDDKDKKKAGWMSKMMCTTPICNKGDEDFDFVIEQPMGIDVTDSQDSHGTSNDLSDSSSPVVAAPKKMSDACTQTDAVPDEEFDVLDNDGGHGQVAARPTDPAARNRKGTVSGPTAATAAAAATVKPRSPAATPLSFSTLPASSSAAPGGSSPSTSTSTEGAGKKKFRTMISKLFAKRPAATSKV